MKRFLVEVFTPRPGAGKLATAERRARLAAGRLSGADGEVRFVGAMYIPEDEICFFLFDAPSSRHAALVAQTARLDPIRVVEAVSPEQEEQ